MRALAWIGLACALAVSSGLMFVGAAAYADYGFRGCWEFPQSNQCADARGTMGLMAASSLLLAALCWIIWRRWLRA